LIFSFSLLVLYLKSDSNKTEQVLELLENLLNENNDLITETVHETLLHSIAQWHIDNDLDFMALNDSRLKDLIKLCQEPFEDNNSSLDFLQHKIKTVYILMPFIMQMLQKNPETSVSFLILISNVLIRKGIRQSKYFVKTQVLMYRYYTMARFLCP
jgi:hypothetical protein